MSTELMKAIRADVEGFLDALDRMTWLEQRVEADRVELQFAVIEAERLYRKGELR